MEVLISAGNKWEYSFLSFVLVAVSLAVVSIFIGLLLERFKLYEFKTRKALFLGMPFIPTATVMALAVTIFFTSLGTVYPGAKVEEKFSIKRGSIVLEDGRQVSGFVSVKEIEGCKSEISYLGDRKATLTFATENIESSYNPIPGMFPFSFSKKPVLLINGENLEKSGVKYTKDKGSLGSLSIEFEPGESKTLSFQGVNYCNATKSDFLLR